MCVCLCLCMQKETKWTHREIKSPVAGEEPYELLPSEGFKYKNNENARIPTHANQFTLFSPTVKASQNCSLKLQWNWTPYWGLEPGIIRYQPSSSTPSFYTILVFRHLFLCVYMTIELCDSENKKVWENWSPHALLAGGIVKWEAVQPLLQRLNTELPYDPEVPLLGMHSRELKICVHT